MIKLRTKISTAENSVPVQRSRDQQMILISIPKMKTLQMLWIKPMQNYLVIRGTGPEIWGCLVGRSTTSKGTFERSLHISNLY